MEIPKYSLEEIGATLGALYTDRINVVGYLKEKGITVHRATISRLRGGSTSGAKVSKKLDCARLLEEGRTLSKNGFFSEITAIGVSLAVSLDGVKPCRLEGFSESIASRAGVFPQDLRRCLRGMRADLVYTEATDINFDPYPFLESIEQFIYDYSVHAPKLQTLAIRRIDEEWNRKTMANFYATLYNCMTPKGIGMWTLYEMKPCFVHYSHRSQTDNNLTPFDRMVLKSALRDGFDHGWPESVRNETGIKLDSDVYENYLNVLLTGKP